LDEPDQLPPDIHIFNSSKQPWIALHTGAMAVPELYDVETTWPVESLERHRIMREKAKAQRTSRFFGINQLRIKR
jgi:hypothetical protein